jgi:hypothetical protein
MPDIEWSEESIEAIAGQMPEFPSAAPTHALGILEYLASRFPGGAPALRVALAEPDKWVLVPIEPPVAAGGTAGCARYWT